MQYQQLTQIRKQKGLEIAKTGKVKYDNGKWKVPSQSLNKSYDVILKLEKSVCNCPDYQERDAKCKHIFAVEFVVEKTIDGSGRITLKQTKRITYSQNWSAYNRSQTTEKEMFMKLLAELCGEIDQPLYTFGRPELSVKDKVFVSALKVYTTFSLRRFITDMKTALSKGYLTQTCCYSSVSNYMRDPKLTPLLHELVKLSSLPLKAVETKFAIDSSGFRTTKFTDYCNEKHEQNRSHEWVKVHICCGVKTNIITAVEVSVGTNNRSADTPQFIPLSIKTYDSGFKIEEMSADKAYSSRDNLRFIYKNEGMPYIPFRSNANANAVHGHIIWSKFYNYFTYHREEFLQHYHLRSNVESTFFMIKSKFTDLVRSKDEVGQLNEVLLKVLCHNIVVLIQEINELGIKPSFYMGV